MPLSKWTVCQPCCEDLDDLFNIVVYDSNNGNILYYIDCDIDPYSFCIDTNDVFIVGGQKTFYNFNTIDKDDRFRLRIAYGVSGVIEYNNLSFDTTLLWGQVLNRIGDYTPRGNISGQLTEEIKVSGTPVIDFRAFNTKKLSPSTTVTLNNQYTGLGYRDCLVISDNYLMFDKFGEDTVYNNRNPVLITNQRSGSNIEKGFTAYCYVTNPVLSFKFSGLTSDGQSINVTKSINIQTNESLASVLNKLNSIHPSILFTTKQTSAIENLFMSYDYQFDGIGILNVTMSSGKMLRGCKPQNATILYFKLTDAELNRIKSGERLKIYIGYNKVDIASSGDNLYVVSGWDIVSDSILIKDTDNRYYLTVGKKYVMKASLIVGNDQPYVFSSDYSYERFKIYDASDCIYHLFNRNYSEGNYRLVYDRPFNYSTGFVNAEDSVPDLITDQIDAQYRAIIYLDYFESYRVDMDFPEPTIAYKPFGIVENGSITVKGTHLEGGRFTDILKHSSGRIYALGLDPNTLLDTPLPRYTDELPGDRFIEGRYITSPAGFNLEANKTYANFFELDKTSLEIIKSTVIDNWLYLPNGLYLYDIGGLREVNGQVWIGNLEYSTDLNFIKRHDKIHYEDMIDNHGELIIYDNNILACVDYEGNCRWAIDIRTGVYDVSLYDTSKDIRWCSEKYLLSPSYPRWKEPEYWAVQGCRSKLLDVDPDGNIYLLISNVLKFSKDGNYLMRGIDPYRRSNLYQDFRIMYKDNKVYTLCNRQQRKKKIPVLRLTVSDNLNLFEQIVK